MTQYQKYKQPDRKMGRRPRQTFFQRKQTDGQQAYGKLLNITNDQRNAKQNHNKISPHTYQNSQQQKERK